jgi:hypothetical protein
MERKFRVIILEAIICRHRSGLWDLHRYVEAFNSRNTIVKDPSAADAVLGLRSDIESVTANGECSLAIIVDAESERFECIAAALGENRIVTIVRVNRE